MPTATTVTESRRASRSARYALGLTLLFALALGTRAIGFGGAVTEDEDQWIARSGAFAHGLATGEWRRTYQTGHPGVTTMWLTVLTLGLDRARPFERGSGAPDVTTIPDFLPALQRARVPFAVLQGGLVVVTAVLAGRLLGSRTGAIAGLLLAAEPFWAGVGPVVGMDGLLTGFLTVSLLALLLAAGAGIAPPTQPKLPLGLARQHRSRLGWAVLAGVTFGLAFLSKATALFAGPFVAALVLAMAWNAWRQRPEPSALPLTPAAQTADADIAQQTYAEMAQKRPFAGQWWRGPVVLGLAWGLAALLVVWLLWPAAWAAPLATVERAITFSARLGGTPHGPGNFLLGQAVEDPGPLFYAVALMLRLGPGTMVGLLLLLLFGAARPSRRVVWWLLGYAVLFLILLAVAPKKVDRYLLPILPALGILAAVGWTEAARRLALLPRHPLSRAWKRDTACRLPLSRVRERAVGMKGSHGRVTVGGEGFPRRRGGEGLQPGTAVGLLIALLALALQVWPLIHAGPYPLAAYNPLAGGVRAAERAIPVGWGDGLDLAGQQIRDLAGGRTVVTSIWSPLRVSFGAHAPGPVISERQINQADFYVDYVHARQRGLTPRLLANRAPDAVVRIGGVDYARVYRLR